MPQQARWIPNLTPGDMYKEHGPTHFNGAAANKGRFLQETADQRLICCAWNILKQIPNPCKSCSDKKITSNHHKSSWGDVFEARSGGKGGDAVDIAWSSKPLAVDKKWSSMASSCQFSLRLMMVLLKIHQDSHPTAKKINMEPYGTPLLWEITFRIWIWPCCCSMLNYRSVTTIFRRCCLCRISSKLNILSDWNHGVTFAVYCCLLSSCTYWPGMYAWMDRRM